MTSTDEQLTGTIDATVWRRVEQFFDATVNGRPTELRDPTIGADGATLACTVTLRSDLHSPPKSAVLVVEVSRSQLIEHDDGARLPRFAPIGQTLALVAGDRVALATPDGELRFLADPHGMVEHLAWSPDGERLLAVVAEPGADAAGAQGSGRLARDRPSWWPHVMSSSPLGGWRRVAVIRPGDDRWTTVSAPSTTTWEAAWLGADRIVAVQSARPDEAAWFDAAVVVLDVLGDNAPQEILRPDDGRCVGLPAGAVGGGRVAVVTATCSDRTVVAGDVTVVTLGSTDDASALSRHTVDLRGLDATWLGWRRDGALVVAGQRGLATVVAVVEPGDLDGGGAVGPGARMTELWASETLTCGGRYPELALASVGTIAMVVEGFGDPPELAVLDTSDEPDAEVGPRRITRLTDDDLRAAASGSIEVVRWNSADGVMVEGLVALPDTAGPHPMVTYVHGGPVWAWRSRWSMGYPYTLALVAAGYAVLHPNPRGSSGRGEEFRAMVIGDLGGAEATDILSGIDHLVDAGVADHRRLGVLGGSHGGFMAEHLVTIDRRFAAAVAYCPVSHWPTMRLTTNDVAAQDRLIGAGAPSPLDRAAEVTTPTLVSTGARDLITPPSQGLMFHRALSLANVPTEYVEYALEGHGVRSFPAQIDFTARVLAWFDRWMGPLS